MALYSQMTPEELQVEMDTLQTKGQEAHDNQDWSQYEVLMKKWYLAKSYQILPYTHIEIGKMYRLTEEYDRIAVTEQVGVMAWGTKESTLEEIAVPIAMLTTEM